MESNPPVILLKDMETPVATPPEIQHLFLFLLIKSPNQAKPGWFPFTVTKLFDSKGLVKESSENLIIKIILCAPETVGLYVTKEGVFLLSEALT